MTSLPETNIAPETLGLEDKFPFGKDSWQASAMLVQGVYVPCESSWVYS